MNSTGWPKKKAGAIKLERRGARRRLYRQKIALPQGFHFAKLQVSVSKTFVAGPEYVQKIPLLF